MARLRFGVIDLYRGRNEAALAIFNSTPLEKNPALVTFQRAAAMLQLGRIQEATALVDGYLATYSADEGGTVTSVKAMLLAKAGNAWRRREGHPTRNQETERVRSLPSHGL